MQWANHKIHEWNVCGGGLNSDFDPLPHIPVVEMVSDDEDTESLAPHFPPKWV